MTLSVTLRGGDAEKVAAEKSHDKDQASLLEWMSSNEVLNRRIVEAVLFSGIPVKLDDCCPKGIEWDENSFCDA